MARLKKKAPNTTPAPKKHSSDIYDDSPSRQLMFDLENALQQVHLNETQLNKIHIHDCRRFQDDLDLRDEESAFEDSIAIAAATARHDLVRADAEAELERFYAELAAEEARLAEEERLRVEAEQARVLAEAKRRAEEEAKRQAKIEQEKRVAQQAAEAKAHAEELARRQKEEAEQEKKRQEAEAAAARQKAIDEKATQEKAKETAAAAETLQKRTTTASVEDAQIHERCLQIHQRLKTFRKEFWALCKTDPGLKNNIGDMRRALKVSVGQLVEKTAAKPQANAKPYQKVKEVFQAAISTPSPMVDAREYFAKVPANIQSPEQCQIPSLLIYAFAIFSKAVISQFSNEAGLSLKAAEAAGVLTAQIFAAPAHQVGGHPMIDILLAKLHFSCPILWGAIGDEKTPRGRDQLGWRKEDGHFVSETRHQERMTGLAAGFASIALRNFSKTSLRNPYPPTNFWSSLATIVDTPPDQVQPTHLYVLRAMLEVSPDRFLQFFGTAAVAGLRHALQNFPASLPPTLQNSSSATALIILRDKLAKEKKFHL